MVQGHFPEYNLDFSEDQLSDESLVLLSRLFSDPQLVLEYYLKKDSLALLENDLQKRIKVPRNKASTVAKKIYQGSLSIY